MVLLLVMIVRVKLTVAFQVKDVEGSTSPQVGNKVEFSITERGLDSRFQLVYHF